jgi:uncharacterized coiled-coil DUF342 family protein
MDLGQGNDEQMDDVGLKIDELRSAMREGFREVRGELKDVRGELKDMRGELKDVRGEARSDIQDLRVEMNTRFDAMQTSITMIWVTTIGGFVAFATTLIAVHA